MPFFTAVASGVTTGTAAPTNSTTLVPLAKVTGTKALATQTLPELSMATSFGPPNVALLVYPPGGEIATLLLFSFRNTRSRITWPDLI